MKLLLTKRAVDDLQRILEYIGQQRPSTALNVFHRFKGKCRLIANQPYIGELRSDYPGDHRSIAFERWVIFYVIKSDVVEIRRVVDGARNIESLLD